MVRQRSPCTTTTVTLGSQRATLRPSGYILSETVTDRAALVAFYDSTDGDNWTNNTNWGSDEPLSTWYGVTTDVNGRVTSLSLSANGLNGTIGAELEALTRLAGLYLNDNELTGTLPPELESLPQLQVIDIRNAGLCVTAGSELHTWLATIDFGGPSAPHPGGGGGGGGGGGRPRTSAPEAPRNGWGRPGRAELSWDAPASDGGAAITVADLTPTPSPMAPICEGNYNEDNNATQGCP